MEVGKNDSNQFDINKICRTCLRDKGEMRSVFLAEESIGQAVVLADMIMGFSTVQVIFSFEFFILQINKWLVKFCWIVIMNVNYGVLIFPGS